EAQMPPPELVNGNDLPTIFCFRVFSVFHGFNSRSQVTTSKPISIHTPAKVEQVLSWPWAFAGVKSVTSGYAGGKTPNPNYKQVCSDETGHAEVIQIEFDPAKVSYDQLLEIFWAAHDPTTLNRQGGDEGTQYRSVILYQNDAQK